MQLQTMISIKGARENNLKNISVDIPRDALTVVTGLSGSGKSSLVFDVIYGEGQRRFLESLSPFVKRFIPQLKKPEVDFLHGLSPVVSIEQKTGVPNPRSTVGTISDIYDYMRLLYTKIGVAHCPKCRAEIPMIPPGRMAEHLISLPPGTKFELYAPVEKIYGEDYTFLLDEIRSKGYRTVRIDGRPYDLGEGVELDERIAYEIEVLIDTFVAQRDIYKRLVLSLENGLKIGEGCLRVAVDEQGGQSIDLHAFFHRFGCSNDHLVMGELHPAYFSFNDPESECRTCLGLGTYKLAKPDLMVVNPEKSIRKGALDERIYKSMNPKSWRTMMIYSLSEHFGFSLDTPFKELPESVIDMLFFGTRGEQFPFLGPEGGLQAPDNWLKAQIGKMFTFEGLVNEIDRWYRKVRRKQELSAAEESLFKKVMIEYTCPECEGTRLKPQRMLVTIGGKTIHQLGTTPLGKLREFLDGLKGDNSHIGQQILNEVTGRLELLNRIGLDYLNLHRRSDTLSGGEAQRIRLSTQIGSGLMGMLYVLDEPSIGLHPRDTHKIVETMWRLRDLGNTVIVVEHDPETINAADHVIEVGPGAGVNGGTIVGQGTVDDLKANPASITGEYLSGKRSIPLPVTRRKPDDRWLHIRGARENSLKNIDVSIPLGVLTCVTGVSGSGKSSLIHDILYKQLSRQMYDTRIVPGEHDGIEGTGHINHVIHIDQSPIGRMPTSNPATYVGFFDQMRTLFASIPESAEKGYTASDFSFNVKGGRCEECKGQGIITTQLQFMPEVESICPSCKGARYQSEILEIVYKEKSIADVLEMSIAQARTFFAEEPLIARKLSILDDLGLGYLTLGQSATIISGGEAQRIKLGAELGKMRRGTHNLYILDEPTTGLHLADIERLMRCLNQLVDAGHSVLVIEHHLDVIKVADYVIDLGPEAGELGGTVVACGTPEEIAAVEESLTGKYLRHVLC